MSTSLARSKENNAQQDVCTPPEEALKLESISNLWIAYHGSGKYPDDFGREFFYAVGAILHGREVAQLELCHVNPAAIAQVVTQTYKQRKVKKSKAPNRKFSTRGNNDDICKVRSKNKNKKISSKKRYRQANCH